MYQYKCIAEIEKILKEELENICDWFVDNKPKLHTKNNDKVNFFSQVSEGLKIFVN